MYGVVIESVPRRQDESGTKKTVHRLMINKRASPLRNSLTQHSQDTFTLIITCQNTIQPRETVTTVQLGKAKQPGHVRHTNSALLERTT